jgi:hypothetical protein
MLRIWPADERVRLGLFASVREFALAQDHPSLEGVRGRHSTWAVESGRRWTEAYETDPGAGPALYRGLENLIAAHGWLVVPR